MPLFRRSLIILLLVVLAAVGATAYQLLPAPEAQPTAPATTAEGTAQAKIFVHVAGAVSRAGVVELPEGARAQDAIEACGGFLPHADTQAVNLAQVLQDGTQLRVPTAVEQAQQENAGPATGKPAKGGKVNINTADAQGLQALYGIGPAFAQRIIDYRTEHGPFQKLEDLMQVKGIGPAKYEKLKDQIKLY